MIKNLSDIVEISLGHAFRGAIENEEAGAFAVLQTKNIDSEGGIVDDFPHITIENYKGKGLIQENDILLSNRGRFRAAISTSKEENLLASSSLYILRPVTDNVIPEYLSVFLNSTTGQRTLQGSTRGALIKSLPKSSLADLVIPVPSIKKQELAVKIWKTHLAREALCRRKAELEKNITDTAIAKLITSS